jgi:16S rRNA (uracil1498-N3)-methyltransferase
MHQLYVDELPEQGETLTLDGDERHYLGRALRARPGERFRLAARDGRAAVAVLESFAGDGALLRVEREDPDPGTGLRLWLELCPPKGDALDQALDMAVQLGVERVRLVRSERTLAVLNQGPLKAERLEKRLQEAARQCLRARIPALAPPVSLNEALSEAGDARRLIMSERGGSELPALDGADGLWVRVLVGPEGGFTAAEIEAAQAALWRPISLGPRPLKTATAVAAALSGLLALRRLSPERT